MSLQDAHAVPDSVTLDSIDLETGIITITITDDNSGNDITALDVTAVTVYDATGQTGNSFTLTVDSTEDVTGTSLTATITIGDTDLYNLKDQLTLASTAFNIDIASGGITSNDGASTGLLASGDVDPTDDSSAPLLSTITLDLDSNPGTLVLTFDEGVTVPTVTDILLGGSPDYTLTTSLVTVGSAGSESFTI